MLWGMISSTQMILHTFLFNIRLPSNAQLLCSKFIYIASFNLIPTDTIYNKIFVIEQTQPLTDNFNALGYGSLSLFHNLGTLFLFFFIHLISLIAFPILYKFRNSNALCKRLYDFKDYTIGGSFIRFFMESYLQVAVSVLLSFKKLSEKTRSEIF